MLKFKRVKPKFSDQNNNLANKPPVVRARLIQGYSFTLSVASFDKLNTVNMYCYAVSYIEITDVVVFSFSQITTSGLSTDTTLMLQVSL